MTLRARILAASGGVALIVAIATVPSQALGLSIVKDPWTLAETTATVKKLADQYRAVVEHLNVAKSQVAALTSHSGFGTLLNGAAQQASRRDMPDAWSDATNVSRLAASSASARAIVDEAATLYRPASAAEIDPAHPNGDAARRYNKEIGTAVAVLAGSQAMLDRAGTQRQTYQTLMDKIEAAPDAKAAADLSNRLQAENGLTQSDLVRATAMQANIVAIQELRLASAKAASARAAVRRRVNLSGGTYAPAS